MRSAICWAWFNVLFFSSFCLVGVTSASHEHEEYTFSGEPLNGWSSQNVTPGSPFGTDYLGPFPIGVSVTKGVIDALPAGNPSNSQPRLGTLSMAVIGYSPLIDSFDVTVNSTNYQLGTAGSVTPIGPNALVVLPFPLIADANGSADLVIEFRKTAGLTSWGLDNVVIDWSQNLPEPSTGLTIPFLLLIIRRGRPRGCKASRTRHVGSRRHRLPEWTDGWHGRVARAWRKAQQPQSRVG